MHLLVEHSVNTLYLTSNVRRVLNVVLFPLGNSVASEFYVSAFRIILSVPFSQAVLTPPMKVEHAGCSETSAHKIKTPLYHPKKNTKHILFRETVKLLLSVIYILHVSA